MARGPQLTDWEKEKVTQAFAESGNVGYAAKQANVAYSIARVYCKDNWSDLQDLRRKTQVDIVHDLALLRRMVIQELMDPARLKKASTHELIIMTGILTDKIQLLEGQPTARVAVNQNRLEANNLTPEERERARELQRKLHGGEAPVRRNIIEAVGSVS